MNYIEYVQTDGACWFDTGIIPDLSTKVELALTPITQRNYPWLVFLGAQNDDDSSDTFQIRRNNRNNNFVPKVDSQYSNVDYTQDTRYELSLDKDNFVVNGDSYSIGATSMDTCNYTLFISAVHNPIWETDSDGSGVPYRASSAKFEEIKIYKNNILVGDFRPANNNGSIGFYDEVSQTFKANLGTGTPVAGPSLSSIIATASKTTLKNTGETINIEVTCENAWTLSTSGDSFLTFSSTGDTSGATITATAPSYSGTTARETTITFTDSVTNDTAVITIKQKKYISGQPVYLGGNEVTELYLGGNAVSEAYLGDVLVYSSVPFVGLNAMPSSISFNSESLVETLKVKSSEAWTMTVPSWVSADVVTGGTGETIVTLTATAQQATTSATITITSANYSASVSVNYYTIVFGGYVELNGPANVVLPFNPNVDYATNNYLRLEMNFDINSGYLLGGRINNSWFSYERAGGINYWNLGNTTGVLGNIDTNTNGYTTTYVMTIDNMNVSDSLGRSEGISGVLPNVSLPLAYTDTSAAGNSNFYEMKVYNSPTNLLYDFVGAYDGVNSCIYDKVSGNKYYPSGTGTVTYHS